MVIEMAHLCSLSLDLDSTPVLIVIYKNEMNVMICEECTFHSTLNLENELVYHEQSTRQIIQEVMFWSN